MPEHVVDEITTTEAAEILRVSPQAVRNYADGGKLRHRRLPGGHRRFRRADVESLLRDSEPEAAA